MCPLFVFIFITLVVCAAIAQVSCLTHRGLFVHLRLVQTLNITCDSQSPHPLPPSSCVHVFPAPQLHSEG